MLAMHYRTVPGTDLRVSELGLGNFIFGTNWWGEFTDEDGINLQNQAFDLGVNFFDTGAAYGNGRAERLLAKTIQYAGRENLIISTKFGYNFYDDADYPGGHGERKQDFSTDFVQFDLEQSLKRLGIDCIDLYQAHNLKLPQFNNELFELLEQLQQAGKIRYWGVSLGPAIGWREEGHQAFIEHDTATVQTVFNLYEQDPGREFCEIAQNRGRGGVISRVPTNSGILDEEFKNPDHQFPDWDHRKFRDRNWLLYGLKKNQIVQPLAQELGISLRQLSAKWLLSWPTVVSIEPNLLSIEHVKEFAAACDGQRLSQDVLDQLERWYARDFDLPDGAHPCDLKSSVTDGGVIRSSYEKPALNV